LTHVSYSCFFEFSIKNIMKNASLKVFISHASKDFKLADEIRSRLESSSSDVAVRAIKQSTEKILQETAHLETGGG